MITHFHVRLQIPDTDVYRDVILPDSVILGDINQVISVCFGWPMTLAYEFVPQQTRTSYLGDTESFVGMKQSLDAENIPVSFAFQKNRELIYYCGTAPSDRISVTLLPTKSLLPEPVFQLNYWHGENQPCSLGGKPFLKQKVEDDLLALREELYLLTDEFDYETALPLDTSDPAALLEELRKINDMEEIFDLMGDLPQEEILSLFGQMMNEFNSQMGQTYTLAQCLAGLNKAELTDIARYNHFKGFSRMNRAELEAFLLQKLTSMEFLTERFKTLTIPEVELLRVLCDANMPLDVTEASLHSLYPLYCGLSYIDETGHYLTVPEDMRQQYRQLLENESVMMETQFYDMLHTFCYTAVYFYGACPVRHLLRKINETMQLVIPSDELESIICPTQHERRDYVLRDGWIIAAELAQDEPEYQRALEVLKAMQNKRTDFFWPDMDQMESLIFMRRLADETLYDEFSEAFRPYLGDGLNLIQALANMEYWIRSGVSFNDVMHGLTDTLFDIPDTETLNVMAEHLKNIWNQTPMWTLGGYTPTQMREKDQKAAAGSNPKGGKIISLQEHRDKKKK